MVITFNGEDIQYLFDKTWEAYEKGEFELGNYYELALDEVYKVYLSQRHEP